MVGIEDPLLRIGNDEVDDHSGPAGGRRRGPREKILTGHRAHKGQLHVRVRINTTRHHVTAARVDYASACTHLKVFANLNDGVPFTPHIRAVATLRGDHSSASNDHAHLSLPLPDNTLFLTKH